MPLKVNSLVHALLEGVLTGLLIGIAISAAYLTLAITLVSAVYGTQFLNEMLSSIVNISMIPSLTIGPLSGLLISLFVSWKAKSYSAAGCIGGVIASLFSLPWAYLGIVFWLYGHVGFFTLPASAINVIAGIWLGQRSYRRKYLLDELATANESHVPSYSVMRGASFFAIAVSLLFIGFHTFTSYVLTSQGTVTEHYDLFWSSESYKRCPHTVLLEFETSPGHVFSTCNQSLLSALEKSGKNPVAIVLERKYASGAWVYNFKEIGNWSGELDFYVSLSCTSSAESPSDWKSPVTGHSCEGSEFPLRAPYRLEHSP